MSAKKSDTGEYEIEPAELFRVFPKGSAKLLTSGKLKASHELLHKLEMLQGAMAHKEELLESERAAMRRERDQYKDQIEGLRNTVETLKNQTGATLQLIADEVQKSQKSGGLFKGWFKKPSH